MLFKNNDLSLCGLYSIYLFDLPVCFVWSDKRRSVRNDRNCQLAIEVAALKITVKIYEIIK